MICLECVVYIHTWRFSNISKLSVLLVLLWLLVGFRVGVVSVRGGTTIQHVDDDRVV